PEDILQAVRTSMLLGAVLPELRLETEVLASDLSELVRLREAIALDGQAREAEIKALAAEQERIAALMAVRQSRLLEVEEGVLRER
ncbi:hypothetical protein, partial [Vibrio parahaemolyticus]|uniref:hypothetical protein n=1 Tax=Vibrio parahaemolyticus TaxID=670 RepID=UPI001AC1C1CE|nr:hypothetical protein [Vibrio parahaemolyticus]